MHLNAAWQSFNMSATKNFYVLLTFTENFVPCIEPNLSCNYYLHIELKLIYCH